MRYQKADPDQYLAITGANIPGVRIVKKGWVMPFQSCTKFSIQPRDYSINLSAMTREKLQFILPVVFTVGPEDNLESLLKYITLLADSDRGEHAGDHVAQIVTGVVEGETRVLASSMTIEEIFTERDQFKKAISKGIQSELDQFGLHIYNANIKELKDAPGTCYFGSLSKKAHEGAINQAKIDVAEAQRKGTVGVAEREGNQNRDIAKINAETAVQKTIRDSERAKAEAELAQARTKFDKLTILAQIEATRQTEARDEELRRDVEVKRAHTELERLRATDVVQATISREAKQQASDATKYDAEKRSDAAAYAEMKNADARAYTTTKEATAKNDQEKVKSDATAYATKTAADARAYTMKVEAEARFLADSRAAEANLISQQKEAAGLTAKAKALGDLNIALGGPQALMQYLMIENGTYTALAKANADAVRGMNPKMTIWNTGTQAGGDGSEKAGMGGIESVRNMYQMLPPLMSTIHEQTGMTLPEWQFGKLHQNQELMVPETPKMNGKKLNGVNGTNGH